MVLSCAAPVPPGIAAEEGGDVLRLVGLAETDTLGPGPERPGLPVVIHRELAQRRIHGTGVPGGDAPVKEREWIRRDISITIVMP